MGVRFLREERAFVFENLDDEWICLKNVLPDQRLHLGLGVGRKKFSRQATAIVDRCEDGQAMLLAELVIVLAMSRRDVDEARACVGGDEVGGEDLALFSVVEERMLVGEADEVGALKFPNYRKPGERYYGPGN